MELKIEFISTDITAMEEKLKKAQTLLLDLKNTIAEINNTTITITVKPD